ncbi:MAG: CZB domain-containing protein [Gammaproteobacteria bacterium]|nr:CZB domain-containing protein [Gammaproteobacteria bacterium]MBU1776662.1 CZB domain-containing protein [Gammaproteobacteria bacterium]MBU1968523.1 CZB domain-containing protein [Gammaproteobacteria bacterium]
MLITNSVLNEMGAAQVRYGAERRSAKQSGNAAIEFGIDFVVVAESHVLMFSRLKDYVYGETQDVSVFESIVRSDSCHLGRWLDGEGRLNFGSLSSFDRLCNAHSEFHVWAAEVLNKMEGGSWLAAERVLKQDFSRSLRRILIALTELNEAATASFESALHGQAWAVS